MMYFNVAQRREESLALFEIVNGRPSNAYQVLARQLT